MNVSWLFTRLGFAAMIGLGIWVGAVTAIIEVQNERAGSYLPRRDQLDGKWRISMNDTPRDKLRGLVSGVGLLQYLLSPLCVLVGIRYSARKSPGRRLWVGVASCMVGGIAFGLAVYRGYFSSLGW